jgi:hypothetical protein
MLAGPGHQNACTVTQRAGNAILVKGNTIPLRKPNQIHVLSVDGDIVAFAAMFHRKSRNTILLSCWEPEQLGITYEDWVSPIVDDYLSRPKPLYSMDFSTGDEYLVVAGGGDE